MVFGWQLGFLCGQRVCRPDWFVFGQCGGRSGWYVGAAVPELEVCLLRWWRRCADDEPPRLCGFSSRFSL